VAILYSGKTENVFGKCRLVNEVMLFKIKHLKGIKSGDISLAFRKWKSQRIKKGSIIKTAVGQVEIVNVTTINENQIDDNSARKSGYNSSVDLLNILGNREGVLIRIEVRYNSPDPRIALRKKTQLSEEEMQAIMKKLNRLDQYSKSGPWTKKVLQAIRENPELRAVDLALELDREKDCLKPNVRKLKNLGLTISPVSDTPFLLLAN
jgi:hypothetical protein